MSVVVGAAFIREPLVNSDSSIFPQLYVVVNDNHACANVNFGDGLSVPGLWEGFHNKRVSFAAQEDFDSLRNSYKLHVGSVSAAVELQGAESPNNMVTTLEQNAEGSWCVVSDTNTEHVRFGNLVDRLTVAGFAAESTLVRGFGAVAVQIAEGEELAAFERLEPIINSASS